MNKKGYYFTMDAILAAIILAAGLMLATSTFSSSPEKATIKHSSDDIIGIMAATKVGGLCRDLELSCECSDTELQNLCSSSKIKNKENTLLELVGELRENNMNIEGGNLVDSIITDNDKFNFRIDGTRIYGPEDDAKSKLLVSSKKVVFGYWEDSSGRMTYWGPYTVEVRTWQ